MTEWLAIPRISRIVPFGYEIDEEDDKILRPIPFELEALEKARNHLKQYSYRDVAAWLSKTTGRSISHAGLKARIEHEQLRRGKAGSAKYHALRYKEAWETAQRIERERIGAKRTPENSDQLTFNFGN